MIPLVARTQRSFAAWLRPAFGEFRFDYDVDRIDALSGERAAEWDRIGKASFLTDDEKREAVGYGGFRTVRKLMDDGGEDAASVDTPSGAPGPWQSQPR